MNHETNPDECQRWDRDSALYWWGQKGKTEQEIYGESCPVKTDMIE